MRRIRHWLQQRAIRWRALLTLLRRAGGWRTYALAVLTLVRGLLPSGIILATGALIGAVPGAVDNGIGSPEGARAVWALAALAAAFLLAAALDALADYANPVLGTRYIETVHDTVARATLGTKTVAELEDPEVVGELAALEEHDRTGVHHTAVQNLLHWGGQRVQGAAAFVLAFGFAWWAPFVLLAGARIVNWTFLRYVEEGAALGNLLQAGKLRRGHYLRRLALDAPTGKEIRVFGLGGWVVGEYARVWLAGMTTIWQGRAGKRWGFVLGGAALLVSQGIVLAAIGWSGLSGAISLAAVTVFVQAVIASESMGPIGDAQWALGRILSSAQQIVDLEGRLAPTPRTSHDRDRPGGGAVTVRLNDVRFTYRGRAEPTLNGLSLTIPAGQSLAVVGENGAGKTTLIKLLCGLYEPGTGSIRLDSEARIGVIFQDFVRYELSLRDNVGFGSLPLAHDQEKLETALTDAGASDLLTTLPAGWDTVLSRAYDNGSDLSGGQWQKVALARALTAIRGGAGLLILDEPTANLDVRAETELFERFLELTKGVTTILVSHRLSSVRHADRIVVIADGRLAEDGTHEQLMAAGGRYARMYSLQASRFAEGAPDA
ncbi:ABC transporter ATP-binding protein [Flindersiella endophytica]